jgi:DNA topoisomerase-1
VRAVESVAKELGNTPAVSRSSYVHPQVIETHLEGTLTRELGRKADRRVAQGLQGLSPEEAAVLALLRRRLEAEAAS